MCFGDWLSRSLDAINPSDVEARFHSVTERNSWATANQAVFMLRSIYRRSRRTGVEAVGLSADHRDIFTIGVYTGMRGSVGI